MTVPSTAIATLQGRLTRLMRTNSTATGVGALTTVTTKPATVNGTSLIIPIPNHASLMMLVPIGGDAANEDGAFQLAAVRQKVEPLYRTITGITKASPAVVTTSAAHGYSTGDRVLIDNVAGMTEVNAKQFIVTNLTGTTFALNGVDSTDYTTYSSGGTSLADKDMHQRAWLKHKIGLFQPTLGTLTDSPGGDYIADTLVVSGSYNTGMVSQIYSPANNLQAYMLLDPLGAPLIEATFDRSGGPAANDMAGMNLLAAFL